MALSEEAKAARKQYMRDYYRKNTEKRKEYAERTWEKKAKEQKKGPKNEN